VLERKRKESEKRRQLEEEVLQREHLGHAEGKAEGAVEEARSKQRVGRRRKALQVLLQEKTRRP